MKAQQGFQIIILFGGLALLSSCNKMSFNPSAQENTSFELPVTLDPTPSSPAPLPAPPPVVPSPQPVTLPDPLRKLGACPDQQTVTSCLKCNVPVDPPAAPVISTKAQKLAQIMTMACQIYNLSYPTPYTAPNATQVAQHILACTPTQYPETTMTPAQTSTINRLLDASNDSLRQRMFKGLWYQPPVSEDFALYFGLENGEAAHAFCLNQSISGFLYTQEYADAVRSNTVTEWMMNPTAQEHWQAAQRQRSQLLSCLNKPSTSAPLPPATPPIPHGCEYKSFEGYYEVGGRDEVATYLAQGYKVAIETSRMCTQLATAPAVGAYSGIIKIAGVKCH